MSFQGYVCWKPESLDLIETVAEDASRAMFLATHQPVRALQTQVGRDGDPHPVNERDVLKVLESKRSEPLIIPIIGASGSGKSHLVRWLQFHLKPTKHRYVIYVPRERTSLADVVELILERIPKEHGDAELDHEVEELQASLRRASREMSETELRRRLVENIAHYVVRLEPTKSPYTNPKEADGWRFLVSKTGLPVLLGDPLYKDALGADGGVIARLAARITQGRAGDTSGEEPLFEFDDLVVDVPNAGLMNRLAKDAYDRFRKPNQRWLADIACDVLNHTLEDVAQETMGLSDNLGRPRVNTIMLALRRVLARQNMELVLLVEDLALLHGIQRQLLEALITPRRTEATDPGDDSEPSSELCQIRAAMAVTTGVWKQLAQSIDTLTRRLESWHTPMFDLDVPAEAARADGEYARTFVAGYLNAIRLGRDGLESALAKFEKATDKRVYVAPSVCSGCKHRTDCHPSFGHISSRGLYPFNDDAINRFVDAEARKSDGRFDPRRMVQGVQKMLDLAGRELPARTFPGPEVREYFVDAQLAMGAPLMGRLVRADAPTAERRRTLLELWGPRPHMLRNIDPRAHEAFDLPRLADELLSDEEETESEIEIDVVPKGRDATVQPLFNELEKWGRGETTLSDNVAPRLRELIFEAVLAQVDWDALSDGRSEDLLAEIGVPDASRCVSIEGSRGDTRTGAAGTAKFVIDRSETSVRFLRGVVQLNRHKSWSFEDGEDGMLAVANVTAAWVADVEERLRARGRTSGAIDAAFVAGMLAVTALILGLDNSLEPPRSPAEALALALVSFNSDQINPDTDRSAEWQRLRGDAIAPRGKEIREAARRALLRRLGRTQGKGENIVALDAADLMEELGRVCLEWTPPEAPPDATAEDKRWSEGISKTLDKATDAEQRRLAQWAKRVATNIDLDSKAPLDDLSAEVEAVLGEVARLGAGATSDAYVRRALENLKKVDRTTFRELVAFYEQDPASRPLPERLAHIAHDWSAITVPIDDLIRRTHSYFEGMEARLEDAAAGGSGGTGPLASATESVATGLTKLKQSLDAGHTAVKV